MMNFLKKIREKIAKEVETEDIKLIDNSIKHKGHTFFDSNKFHLKVIIKSPKLKKMNKIDAHKKIYSVLSNEMKNKIHALEIEIS